jgi:hypothetical protein
MRWLIHSETGIDSVPGSNLAYTIDDGELSVPGRLPLSMTLCPLADHFRGGGDRVTKQKKRAYLPNTVPST